MKNPLQKVSGAILAEITRKAQEDEYASYPADIGRKQLVEYRYDPDAPYFWVNASWHPEGYQGARHYLKVWAPETSAALEGVSDEDLDAAWRGDDGFWHQALQAAWAGASRALDRLISDAEDEAEVEV
jgi:hypothetical protein